MLAQLVARLHERSTEEGGNEGEEGPLVIAEDCAVSILKTDINFRLTSGRLTQH